MIVILPAPARCIRSPVPIQPSIEGVEIHLAQELEKASGLDGFVQVSLDQSQGFHIISQEQVPTSTLAPNQGFPAQFPSPGSSPGLHIGFFQASRPFIVFIPGGPSLDSQGHFAAQIPGSFQFGTHSAVPADFVPVPFFSEGCPFAGRPPVPVGKPVTVEIPGTESQFPQPEGILPLAFPLEGCCFRCHQLFQGSQVVSQIGRQGLFRCLPFRFQYPSGHLLPAVGTRPIGQGIQIPHSGQFVDTVIIMAVHRDIGRYLGPSRRR